VFPQSRDLLVIRDGEFYLRDPSKRSERQVDPQRRGSQKCSGWARGGVVVECDTREGKPRLTILTKRGTTEVRFPRPDANSMNYGVGYLNCSATWVTFTFNDKAHVLNLKTGRLGTLKGAQYTISNSSWHHTINYRKTDGDASEARSTAFIRLR
jgi:hypothetical protein